MIAANVLKPSSPVSGWALHWHQGPCSLLSAALSFLHMIMQPWLPVLSSENSSEQRNNKPVSHMGDFRGVSPYFITLLPKNAVPHNQTHCNLHWLAWETAQKLPATGISKPVAFHMSFLYQYNFQNVSITVGISQHFKWECKGGVQPHSSPFTLWSQCEKE